MNERKLIYEAMYLGVSRDDQARVYPRYLYKDDADPILVHNEEEDKEARAKGFDSITASALSNRYMQNWFWDLEDMSAKQLSVFAKDAYGVDLPVEAGQQRLFEAVTELTRFAPQHKDQLVLMAQTMEMNYDATLEEIKRLMKMPEGATEEVEKFEVIL